MMVLNKVGYFDRATQVESLNFAGSAVAYPKQDVVAYLESGIEIFSWLEDVRCLYGCTAENIGSAELTDGVWVWTREFVHYVACHHIAIPERFQIFLRQRSYKFVENDESKIIKSLLSDPAALETKIQYSDGIWNAWLLENNIQRGAEPAWRSSSTSKKQKFDLPDDW